MEHNLKILPEHFEPVRQGIKTAELRLNDRNYQVGDLLALCEIAGPGGCFTGEWVDREVTHVADVGAYLPGYVLLSMKPCGQEPHDDVMW